MLRPSLVAVLISAGTLIGCGAPAKEATPPPRVSVAVSPTSVSLQIQRTLSFAATVQNAKAPTVTWSVNEGAVGGTINNAGVYTAPMTVGKYHVVATSTADPLKSATAEINVVLPPILQVVSFSPADAPSELENLSLTINGSGFQPESKVMWGTHQVSATVSSDTQIVAAFQLQDLRTAGPVDVRIVSPGGVTSATSTYTLRDGPAVIRVYSDSANDVYGRFVPGSSPQFVELFPGGVPFFVEEVPPGSLVNTCLGNTDACSSTTIPLQPGFYQERVAGHYYRFFSTFWAGEIWRQDTCIGEPSGCVSTPALLTSGGELFEVSQDGRFLAVRKYQGSLTPIDPGSKTGLFLVDTCLGVQDCTVSSVRIATEELFLLLNIRPTITQGSRYVVYSMGTFSPPTFQNPPPPQTFAYDTCIGAPPECSPATVLLQPNVDHPYFSDAQHPSPNRFPITYSGQQHSIALFSKEVAVITDNCLGIAMCQPQSLTMQTDLPPGTNCGGFTLDVIDRVFVSEDGRHATYQSMTGACLGAVTWQVRFANTCFGSTDPCTPTFVPLLPPIGAKPACDDCQPSSISADGKYVTFLSKQIFLPGASSAHYNVYVARTR